MLVWEPVAFSPVLYVIPFSPPKAILRTFRCFVLLIELANTRVDQIVIIVYAVPLHKRPKYQGFFGAVFGISSVLGPLVGGAFTTDVTWRWCFYINLPLGGIVMVFVFFLLHIPDRANDTDTLKHKLQQLNIWGLLALLPGIICLCLALQYGGFTYSVSFESELLFKAPLLPRTSDADLS